jgi:hypothetical protein
VRFNCLVDLSIVTTVDQVWATDITYIPLYKGFLCPGDDCGSLLQKYTQLQGCSGMYSLLLL